MTQKENRQSPTKTSAIVNTVNNKKDSKKNPEKQAKPNEIKTERKCTKTKTKKGFHNNQQVTEDAWEQQEDAWGCINTKKL